MNMIAQKPIVEGWGVMTLRHRDEKEAAILDLAAAGHTGPEAARLLGMDLSNMRSYIELHDILVKFKPTTPRKKSEGDVYARRLALSQDKSLTCADAARIEGVTREALQSYSYRRNLTWKPGSKWMRVAEKRADKENDDE